jgi:hypothetical protein
MCTDFMVFVLAMEFRLIHFVQFHLPHFFSFLAALAIFSLLWFTFCVVLRLTFCMHAKSLLFWLDFSYLSHDSFHFRLLASHVICCFDWMRQQLVNTDASYGNHQLLAGKTILIAVLEKLRHYTLSQLTSACLHLLIISRFHYLSSQLTTSQNFFRKAEICNLRVLWSSLTNYILHYRSQRFINKHIDGW